MEQFALAQQTEAFPGLTDARERPEMEMYMADIDVVRLSNGLDFGVGTISKDDRLDAHDDPLDHEIIDAVERAIQRPDITVPVSTDKDGLRIEDDGCGDGRGVNRVFRGEEELQASLDRPKVFGGGLMMAVAARIGLGNARGIGLQDTVLLGKRDLGEKGMRFGIHTDTHAHGENCGCGAIDKAPEIIRNVRTFESQISSVVSVLTRNAHDPELLEDVIAEFKNYGRRVNGEPYSGRVVSQHAAGDKVVVKELAGDHKETHIVINLVSGTTVNQQFIREASDEHAQTFATDEWRIRELATSLYDDKIDQEKAYLSMLVYTLATAGTLTKGDLPVFVVAPTSKEETVAA